MFQAAAAAYYYSGNDSDEGSQVDVEVGLPPVKRARKSRTLWTLGKMRQLLYPRNQSYFAFPITIVVATLCLLFLLLRSRWIGGVDGRSKPIYSAKIAEEVKYPLAGLQNLVMVAGHSVYTSNGCTDATGEASWYLESYQKHPGQAQTFLQHIKAGVEETGRDDVSVLLFSGGETRKDAGPRSEAQSYWIVADTSDWFGKKKVVRWRALTEEFARDSFENLLFSICRFRELTGHYPQNITVVSYDFKEYRFANLHRTALRFPASRFFFRGTPPSLTSAAAAKKGEESVQEQFRKDPYGCAGTLHNKRKARDPFHRVIPYPTGCPEMQALFSYCGTDIYPGKLPWDM